MDNDSFFQNLRFIVGEENVLIEKESLYNYSKDYSSGKLAYPLCVVKPSSAEQISETIELCNKATINIVVRAGGSGVSGGALANDNDVIISLEKLNKIEEINAIDRTVILESGVNTKYLQQEVLKKGLCFPQNISSSSMSCIGGNVAVSSGSPKSLKYGGTKNYVLNLQVVLPNGQIIWTGRNVSKNASGYNLTQLFVGSEGTLGIITKIVLQLVIPKKEKLLLVPFRSTETLFKFIEEFFLLGFEASSLEFIDKRGYDLVLGFLNEKNKLGEEIAGLLWIEFESDHLETLSTKVDLVYDLILKYTQLDVLVAETEKDIISLWKYRKKIGMAVMNYSKFKDLDIVVPRSKASIMYRKIDSICNELELEYIVVGHIGDGNFHVNIFNKYSLYDSKWEEIIQICTSNIYTEAMNLGGDISGEHGIGSHGRNDYINSVCENKIQLMKEIKKIFDPNMVLNTNNIFLN